jgi:hypothetical protein
VWAGTSLGFEEEDGSWEELDMASAPEGEIIKGIAT